MLLSTTIFNDMGGSREGMGTILGVNSPCFCLQNLILLLTWLLFGLILAKYYTVMPLILH